MTAALIAARWPELLPVLAANGLEARFVEAEDESVDDAIEIRRIGAGEDQDLGDIQVCFDGLFCGNSWTSEARDARRQGAPHRTPAPALDDLIGYLRRDGLI